MVVRTTETGEVLETVRIFNGVDRLDEVMARAGVDPEVVLEATYGWYWAVDALQAGGAKVHLAHPLGVKAFEYRRVKNDVRDATDLADLLRLGRLPEAWVAPPATRELRELVRHRAKLVGLRSTLQGRGPRGTGQVWRPGLLERPVRRGGPTSCSTDSEALPTPYAARIASLRRVIETWTSRSTSSPGWLRGRLARDPGYRAVQTIPGIGPILGAVFTAEIGDITRFHTAPQLACWAGLTPKHHESDSHVHRGRITKQGSRLVRWAAVESVQRILPDHTKVGPDPRPGRGPARPQHWGRRRRPAARWSTSSTRCVTIRSGPAPLAATPSGSAA